MTLSIGDKAPDFTMPTDGAGTVSLAALKGKKVILYFYPKDDTPGCTKEACGFRDRLGDLQTNNVAVIGVSHDTADSHKKFATEYNLTFPLIADPDGKIIHVTDSMSPQPHFDEMKLAIAGLKKN